MMRGVDYLDDLEEDTTEATARARKLAARLRDAGVGVASVTEATLEADAAVNLEDGRHVQVGVDGTFCVVEQSGDTFIFSKATRRPVDILRELRAGQEGADAARGEYRLDQGDVELLRGDGTGLLVVFNNLAGVNYKGREAAHAEYLNCVRGTFPCEIEPRSLRLTRVDAASDYAATHGAITREYLILQCTPLDSMDEALAELSRPGSFLVYRRREWGVAVVPDANKSWYVRKNVTAALIGRPAWFTLEGADAENAYYTLSDEGRAEFMRRVARGKITTEKLRNRFEYICGKCGTIGKRTEGQIERRRETLTTICASCGESVELKPGRI